VQIEKYQACSNSLATAATTCGATVSQAHSSLFPTRLALARWMYGGEVPHVYACTRHIGRAAWYDQAQQDFQAWIDAGGFHRPELVHTDSAIEEDAAHGRRHSDPPRSEVWRADVECRNVRSGNTRPE